MLNQLYFVPDIKARYHCRSDDTARRYMRQMGATGKPLFVTEEMIDAWERGKQRSEVRIRRPKEMKIPGRKVG